MRRHLMAMRGAMWRASNHDDVEVFPTMGGFYIGFAFSSHSPSQKG
jgi:hypothetical protein